MNTGKRTPEDHARDADDFGRLLGTLLDRRDLSPEQVVQNFLTPDLKKIKPELEALKLLVPGFATPLLLLPGAAVMAGGGGVVFQVTNAEIRSLNYALKIPRPSLFAGDMKDVGIEYGRTATEYLNHAPLAHENVARVITASELSVLHSSNVRIVLRAVLMEWIDSATPLTDYFALQHVTHADVTDLLIQAFLALEHLHSHHLVHWDIKSDNFLVNGDGVAKLMDIGNARRRDDPNRELIAFSSRWNLPEELAKLVRSQPGAYGSSRRSKVPLPDLRWDDPWLDLWMFARELNRLFAAETTLDELDRASGLELVHIAAERNRFLARAFPEENADARFALKFLRLVLRRLLRPTDPTQRGYYTSARQVALDLRKLLPEFGAAQGLAELQAIPQSVLRLPQSGNAPYTPRVGRIINSPFVVRLSKHLQLGTLIHVYPGGSHRRSEHIAGVFHTTAQFVRSLYADRLDPFWRVETERRDINAVLLAALLHDIGHVAFGHFLEEMGGLFRGRAHEDYVTFLLDPKDESLEARGIRLSGKSRDAIMADRDTLKALISSDWIDADDNADDFMAYVAELLVPLTESSAALHSHSLLVKAESAQLKTQILHSILDSAVDADKLDYLLRDAHHCGVKYAEGIDVDRFFQSLTTIPTLEQQPRARLDALGRDIRPPQACVGIDHKGILPVESILIARYQMFGSVYWHHTARAETAMLQFAVMEFVGASEIDVEERLEELLDVFRRSSDEEALQWFLDRVFRADLLSRKRRDALQRICRTLLGERSHLYRVVFELRYEPETGRRASHGTAKAVYQALLRKAEERESAQGPVEYITAVRDLRADFTLRLSNKLGRVVDFEDGEVLIDVPPAGKDQIENIFVTDGSRPKPIQDLSPVANAVRDTFAYWARRVRVFMSPNAVGRAEAKGLSKGALAEACWAVLQDIEKADDPQEELQLPPR